MAMSSLVSLIFSTIALLIALVSPSYCLNHHRQPHDTFRGLMIEEKTRLGSTPPSCHNKCNQCHPCMAVQVPTIPSQNEAESSRNQAKKQLDYFESSPSSNRYSNYKPLGWKCRCGGHLYNP